MHLIIDIGNTNIVFATSHDNTVKSKWRVSTYLKRTSDEYYIWFSAILEKKNIFENIIVGSVVPEVTEKIKRACFNFFNKRVYVINEDIKVSFPTEVENKKEIGTDRIVNALAAWNNFKQACIIIDFGTATTFDIVNIKGSYMGGVICPGINLSLQTLHAAAARLPRIAITKPKKVIGKSTEQAMSSGIYYGYIGLIKYLVDKIKAELGCDIKIILTGGLAYLFSETIGNDNIIKKNLTIDGLFLAFKKYKM